MFQSLSDKQMAAYLDSGKTESKERTRSRSPHKKAARPGKPKKKSPSRRSVNKKKSQVTSKSRSPPEELQVPVQGSPLPSPQNRRVEFGSGTDDTGSLKAQVSLGALKGRNERKRSAKDSVSRSRSGKKKKGEKASNTATRGGIKCEVQTQTDLRGVEHRILVRAKKEQQDGEEESDMGNIQSKSPAKIEIEDNKSRTGIQGTYTEYLGENQPPRQVRQEAAIQPPETPTS